MPVWIQFIANGIPLTHFLKIFRVLVVEQGTLTQTSDSLYAMIYIYANLRHSFLYCITHKKEKNQTQLKT